jgi:hypothetical protein
MSDGTRWVIGIIIVLVVIGLIAIARGPEHHRGDEVGERASGSVPIEVVVM